MKTPSFDARAFVTFARPREWPRLWAFLNSCYAYHGESTPVYVVVEGDVGRFQEEALRHPLAESLRIVSAADAASPGRRGGAWAPLALPGLLKRIRTACVLNSDSILLSSLDDVFTAAERGRIVASATESRIVLGGDHQAYTSGLSGVAVPELIEGFVCLDLHRHWDLASMWGFAATHARYLRGQGAPLRLPARHDFDVLATLIEMQRKAGDLQLCCGDHWWFPAGQAFDDDPLRLVDRQGGQFFVQHRDTGQRLRILPGAGVKWHRRSGRLYWGHRSTRLTCFQHFAAWPRAQNDVSPRDEERASPQDSVPLDGVELISRSAAPPAGATAPAESLEVVNSIWIGKRILGPTQQLAIRSFQAAGYRFALWSYERELTNLPAGVVLQDARELLPSSAMFKLKGGTHPGSLAFHCDVLQLHGLYRRGGLWAHLDAECLKPLGKRDFIFVRHWEGDDCLCTYVVKAPARHEAIAEAIVEASTVDRENYHWHDMMRSLGRVVTRRQLPVLTTAEGFHDDRDRHEQYYFRDGEPTGDRYIHHWCHSYTRPLRRRASERSYYRQRLARYGIQS